jgi:subtilisin family serine protease
VKQGWLRLALTATTFAVLVAIPAFSTGAHAAPADAPEIVPGELVVGFEDDTTSSAQKKAVTMAGGRIEERLESIDSLVVEPRGARTTDRVATELARSATVEFVEPNFIVRARRLPNDGSFPQQWALRNTGQLGGTADADINATGAWDVSTGGAVTVAIVDTGIDHTHPDLNDNLWINPADPVNGIDDDGNGFTDDVNGADFSNDDSQPYDDSSHGTHVAGIVGAEGNNTIGVTGLNWQVKLIGLKFLNANGEGNTANASEAIDYAVRAGARVVNASWGGPAFSYALFKAIRNANNRGVVVVAAAGNEGDNSDSSPEYPAAFDLPNVISVAASDTGDNLLDFSNYGSRTVDLAAPGDEIYSTVPKHTNASGYTFFSGTSMAAPHVSGAAALYLSRAPAGTVDQVRDAIFRSVDPLPSLAGKTVTGGRLNVAKMFGVARGPAPQPAPARDSTAPSPFSLIRPRNKYSSSRRGVRFRWQRSHDASGIRFYRFYVDGKKRRTVKDPDGPGGRSPATRVRYRLGGGRHRWYVRAFDYAGNSRKSRRSRKGSKSTRVLFVGR